MAAEKFCNDYNFKLNFRYAVQPCALYDTNADSRSHLKIQLTHFPTDTWQDNISCRETIIAHLSSVSIND